MTVVRARWRDTWRRATSFFHNCNSTPKGPKKTFEDAALTDAPTTKLNVFNMFTNRYIFYHLDKNNDKHYRSFRLSRRYQNNIYTRKQKRNACFYLLCRGVLDNNQYVDYFYLMHSFCGCGYLHHACDKHLDIPQMFGPRFECSKRLSS